MKKTITFLFTIAVLLSLTTGAFAGAPHVLSNVNQVWDIGAAAEPAIYRATLTVNGEEKDVYCVVCDGMDFNSFDPSNPRSITNAVKLCISCENNQYVKTVCDAILSTVPEGASLVLLGRSMGGMVIQQVAAQSRIKEPYEILNILAVGSPYIYTKQQKEGTLRRCVDIADPVPFLSFAGLANPLIGNVSLAASGIIGNVHMRGYTEGNCWKKYDCLGVKNGGATITLNEKCF